MAAITGAEGQHSRDIGRDLPLKTAVLHKRRCSTSTSWINANDNSTFLGASLPATKVGTYTGLGPTVTQASGASQGDVISYDWNGDGVVDHQAVVVTSDGQSVDAHTNNRYHAYWTLAQYNAQWQTTIITVYHVTPGTK